MMLLLGSCGSYKLISDKVSNPIILKCPDYLVPEEAASLSRFRKGTGFDLVDVKFEVKIKKVQLGCISNIERNTKAGSMEIDVNLLFAASLGPANLGRKIKLGYFVSVVSPANEILGKEDIPIVIEFPENKSNIIFSSEPVFITLQIRPDRSINFYRVFVGLKLNQDEVLYNREKIANQR